VSRDGLSLLIERELVDLLEREITYLQETERFKRVLTQRYDWCFTSVFEELDTLGEDRLTAESVRRFLRINGYSAATAEVDAIVRRLDSNGDFVITFQEFVGAFTPSPDI
jgi:Ca2+-binding EF-hand superfamily protein